METKEGSVKRLIRIHLNAHKKCLQQRKLTQQNSKNTTVSHLRKITFKSPEVLIRLIQKENKENGRSNSIDDCPVFPKLQTANFETNRCLSQKNILETLINPKSSTDIKLTDSPKQRREKIKRIKSEQSMALLGHFETTKKKMSKYKVMVKNPFERKLSKSPETMVLKQSQILKNESRISNEGKKDIAKIISLI